MGIESTDVKQNKEKLAISSIRKEKSRHAARNRRSNENIQYGELARLLPLPIAITSQLDKASIIRLTISFIKYRDLVGRERQLQKELCFAQDIPTGLGLHMLQALDGFLMVISQEGKFVYISETISQYLGLAQLDLVGSNVFSIIHPDDQKEFSELLCKPILAKSSCMRIDTSNGNAYENYQDSLYRGFFSKFIRMKCTIDKRGGNVLRSGGYKVILISGNSIPYKHVDSHGERSFALIALGQPLPSPTIFELKLDTKVFVSRVNMDLKISYCEGRIRKYMDFTAKDIVGMSAYDFYHLKDMHVVQVAHNDCINHGKCVSQNYRWMNKTGGWVYMQTVGTVLTRKKPKGGEESQILCVNYINSDVEEPGEIMHTIQQRFLKLDINGKKDEKKEKDPFSDYEMDTNSPVPSKQENEGRGTQKSDAMEKDKYILAINYGKQLTTNSDEVPYGEGSDSKTGIDLNAQWKENQLRDCMSDLATRALLSEFERENMQGQASIQEINSVTDCKVPDILSPPTGEDVPIDLNVYKEDDKNQLDMAVMDILGSSQNGEYPPNQNYYGNDLADLKSLQRINDFTGYSDLAGYTNLLQGEDNSKANSCIFMDSVSQNEPWPHSLNDNLQTNQTLSFVESNLKPRTTEDSKVQVKPLMHLNFFTDQQNSNIHANGSANSMPPFLDDIMSGNPSLPHIFPNVSTLTDTSQTDSQVSLYRLRNNAQQNVIYTNPVKQNNLPQPFFPMTTNSTQPQQGVSQPTISDISLGVNSQNIPSQMLSQILNEPFDTQDFGSAPRILFL